MVSWGETCTGVPGHRARALLHFLKHSAGDGSQSTAKTGGESGDPELLSLLSAFAGRPPFSGSRVAFLISPHMIPNSTHNLLPLLFSC